MKIKEALRFENGIRLSNSNGRWLIIDDIYVSDGQFVVYSRPMYAKKTTELYRGNDEDQAIAYLLGEKS